jgi:hypothetical protein
MTELQTNRPRNTRLAIWVLVFCVAAAAAGVLWFLLGSPRTSRYQPIIDAYAGRQIFPDSVGRITLTPPYTGLTPRDEIFVQRRPDGAFLAFFPTFYPKGAEIAGLLYTSRPFEQTDWFRHGLGIDLVHPFLNVGPWSHLRIDSRIDEHWYRVSQGME